MGCGKHPSVEGFVALCANRIARRLHRPRASSSGVPGRACKHLANKSYSAYASWWVALSTPHVQAGQAWSSGPQAHNIASRKLLYWCSVGWTGTAFDAGAHDHPLREGRVRPIQDLPSKRVPRQSLQVLCTCNLAQQPLQAHAVEGSEEDEPVAAELAALSSRVDPAGQIQPDYQPMRWESLRDPLRDISKSREKIYVHTNSLHTATTTTPGSQQRTLKSVTNSGVLAM